MATWPQSNTIAHFASCGYVTLPYNLEHPEEDQLPDDEKPIGGPVYMHYEDPFVDNDKTDTFQPLGSLTIRISPDGSYEHIMTSTTIEFTTHEN